MKLAALTPSLTVVIACGGGHGNPAPGDGNTDHPDAAACAQVTLASAARDVVLPTGYLSGSFTQISGSAGCGPDGGPSFALADMTADGRPDLIVTHLCGDAAVGDTRWIVHPSHAGGFGAATAWGLPTGYLPSSFTGLEGTASCGPNGEPSYALLDLTGDHRPDLVIPRLCGDATVGDIRWIVHPGGDAGFGAAIPWQIPSGYLPGSFTQLDSDTSCGPSGVPSFVLADVTGDGRPDLVVTRLCGDSTVGDTRWIVHPSGDAGFGAAITWQLPTGYLSGSFQHTAGIASCGPTGSPTFALADATGDGRPDIIVTRLCGDSTVGDTRWIVHPGGASGFGAAATWRLPPGYASGAFQETIVIAGCGANGTPSYSLVDLTGDRRPDIVVTRLCGDSTVGDTRWIVYAGGGDGFASTPDSIALPPGYLPGTFQQLTHAASCGPAGDPSFVVTDLDGDARPDVVVTRLCGDATVGDTRWLLHGSACSP